MRNINVIAQNNRLFVDLVDVIANLKESQEDFNKERLIIELQDIVDYFMGFNKGGKNL